ncbi:MAG TPA: hypothetical protein VIM57_08090 [Luteolibacter sp.]
MVTDPAGAFAALTPVITIGMALFALVNPRRGLFALVPLVVWADEYKRLAIYFGGPNMYTVMQTLAMPLVVLAALNAGYFLNILFGRVKMDGVSLLFFVIAVLAGGGVYFTMTGSFIERVQRAANLAGYITLVPIAYTYFRSLEEWRHFFAIQVVFALPAAAWAIKQYYYGFDQIEWTYARSGLSRVHFSQMFGFDNPRVFGFFGSASALGCASIYGAFAWWHAFRFRSKRWFWVFAALLLTWTLVVSTQRTALVYPLIVAVAAFFFRTKLRTLFFYGSAALVFVLGVLKSDYLINRGLEDINRAIQVKSSWGQEVLNVNTFSDRIRGWQRLNRAKTYSLFGTGEGKVSASAGIDVNSETYNHDIINKILIKVGVVGLLVILLPAVFIMVLLHRAAYRSPARQSRADAAFILALALPMIGLSFIGGDNFNANPINMQIWTAFVGALICRAESWRELRRKKSQVLESPVLSSAVVPTA